MWTSLCPTSHCGKHGWMSRFFCCFLLPLPTARTCFRTTNTHDSSQGTLCLPSLFLRRQGFWRAGLTPPLTPSGFCVLLLLFFSWRLGTWIYAAASSPSPKQKATQPKPPASWSKALNLVLGVAFLGLLGFYLVSEDGTEVLLEDVLPEMEDALLRDDVFTVYSHASEWLAETGNPLFESYLDKVTSRGDLFTNRDGVELFFRFYNDTTKTWFPLGPSPNLGVRLPYSYLQIKFVEGEERVHHLDPPVLHLRGEQQVHPPAERNPSFWR